MAVLGTLCRLPGRILRQLARRNTSDIVALDGSKLSTAPDTRGWELTVVSSDLGAAKVRSLIEGALPRRLCEEFITTVSRGGLLYMLFRDGRMEHYNWVGMTEPHQAHFVAEPDDTVSWNSWTIREARGKGLFGLSLNLMAWHMKQQGYRRVLGAVEIWNEPSWKGTQRGGLECLGRYTLWRLLGGAVFLRIEHAASGRSRYRLFFGLKRNKAPKLRHPATLPEPEASRT
jgi:hypothetical protein